MLVSWNWLNELISIPAGLEEVAERLTVTGNEIESIEYPCEKLNGIVVAEVVELKKHPESDRLFLATLKTGDGEVLCVTAAENLTVGDKVPYGPSGAVLNDGSVLSTREFKGIESSGMMLSADEIGLPEIADEYGILRLPADAPVGEDLKPWLGLDDAILELSITPNRGDMLSMRGVVREVHALFPESELRFPKLPECGGSESWPLKFDGVRIEDKGCRGYSLGLVRDVRIVPSPLKARIRLAMAGIRPISNIVDATNLAMLYLGQPFHAFDLDRLPAKEIVIRKADDNEKFVTLDDKERSLQSGDLLITSGGETVALAGVMGGANTEIADDTRNVVVECAAFDAPRISKTSRRLGINSEAAFRYSRGVDPSGLRSCLAYILELMEEWKCGVPCRGVAYTTSGDIQECSVTLTRQKLQKIILWSDMNEASGILERLGMVETSRENDARTYSVPSYRPDIAIEEDLIEEIARIRGYKNIPSRLPQRMSSRGDIGEFMRASRGIRRVGISRGYVEIVTYSFQPPAFVDLLRLPAEDLRSRPKRVGNPLSVEQSCMRTTLLPGLLGGLMKTMKSGWRAPVRLLELGRIFLPDDDSGKYREIERAGGLVFTGADRRFPYGEAMMEDFYSVKADVIALAESRGVTVEFLQGEEPFGHLGQTAHLMCNGRKVGYLLRLKPAIEKELEFAGPVYAFELDMDILVKGDRVSFKDGSLYPSVYRDISLVVPKDRPASQVMEEIRSISGDLLWKIRLFDIYEGKGIPEGARSLAFSMAYRHMERTLKDGEVDKLHSNVRIKLSEMGYTLR